MGSQLKLGADDPYVRAVRTGWTYGPDVLVCIFAPVRTARNYGPYVRVVCTELESTTRNKQKVKNAKLKIN